MIKLLYFIFILSCVSGFSSEGVDQTPERTCDKLTPTDRNDYERYIEDMERRENNRLRQEKHENKRKEKEQRKKDEKSKGKS